MCIPLWKSPNTLQNGYIATKYLQIWKLVFFFSNMWKFYGCTHCFYDNLIDSKLTLPSVRNHWYTRFCQILMKLHIFWPRYINVCTLTLKMFIYFVSEQAHVCLTEIIVSCDWQFWWYYRLYGLGCAITGIPTIDSLYWDWEPNGQVCYNPSPHR